MASSDTYKLLREWHLARLRNLALVEAEQLAKTLSDRTIELVTPARLIALDKQLVSKRVEDQWTEPSADSAPALRRHQVTISLVAWLLAQYISVIVLSLYSGGVTSGAAKFMDATFLSLWPHTARAHSVLEHACFLSFFYLPVMLLAITPSRAFLNSPLLRVGSLKRCIKHLSSEVSFSVVAILTVAGCVLLLTLFNTEGLDPGFLFAWLALETFALLSAAKITVADHVYTTEALRFLTTTSGSPLQDSSDDALMNARKICESVEMLKQREQSIADFSKTVIMSLDHTLAIKAVSPSCLAQWGLLENELIDRPVISLLFPNDSKKLTEVLNQNTEPSNFELRMVAADKRPLDQRWYVEWSPKYQLYFVACDDITDRMTLERTRAEFIAELAHDMRSPLSSVSLSLSSLLDGAFGSLPPPAQQFAKSGQNSLVRVLGLIDEILQAEQLRTGKLKPIFASLNLFELCSTIVGELSPQSAKRDVVINMVDLDVTVTADKKLIARAITNILSNAISFSPKGGKIDVSCEQKDQSITVQIKDEGPGVPEEFQSLIFERFGTTKKRADQNRTSTGLGLSICREIIVAHGGLIGVSAEQSKGSTFWFTIPREQDATLNK